MSKVIRTDQLGDLRFLETGTFLDNLCGGIPYERITEIFGEEKVGKSTLCLQIVAAAQKQGLKCLWVDVEHSMTKEYAVSLGVDIKKLGILRLEFAEDYIDEIETEIPTGKWDLIVLDSIGDLSSRIEHEKAAGEKAIAQQASLMTRFSRKLAPQVSFRKMIFIGINHSRIDFMGGGKLYTMGGKKWSEKKKLSIRLKEKSGVLLKSGENVVGKVIVATVFKSGVSADEKKEVDAQIIFGSGFNAEAELVDTALRKGLIEKRANSYFLHEEKIAVGAAKLRVWAKENREQLQELIKGV